MSNFHWEHTHNLEAEDASLRFSGQIFVKRNDDGFSAYCRWSMGRILRSLDDPNRPPALEINKSEKHHGSSEDEVVNKLKMWAESEFGKPFRLVNLRPNSENNSAKPQK